MEIRANDQLYIGKGVLQMKGQSEYLADYFKLTAHVELKWVFYDANSRMHEYELDANNLPVPFDGDVLDIAEMDTGWSIPTVLTRFNTPVTMGHVKQVYFIVQWKGENDDEVKKEKIILTPEDV